MNACSVFQLLAALLGPHSATYDNWKEITPVLEYQRKQCVIIEKKAEDDAFEAKVKEKAKAKEEEEKKKPVPTPTPTPSATPSPEAKK
jgi:hypothetical protein